LAETRQSEAEAYAVRIEDQNAMIAGIDAVIQIFDTELKGNAELDAEAVAEVRAALVDVRASISESITSDTASEDAAKTKYDNFVAAQNARLKTIKSTVTTLTNEIDALNARLAEITQEIASQRQQIAAAEEVIRKTTEALNSLNAQYKANSQTRTEQLTLIGQVRAELTNNPENVQEFLNNAE